ncbi:MAG: pyridoxal phosphate-dependent aminotransferase [Thermoanaerobaculia bacterium]
MTTRRDTISSYIEWAKLNAGAPFNLARSDVADYPLALLPLARGDLELTGESAYGYAPLQERLAAKAGVAADCVVAAIGTSMANHLVMASLLEPGDEVVIEEPTYEALTDVAGYLGAVVRRFPRRFADGFALDPAAVEGTVRPRTRLIVVTDLHNPSSARADGQALRDVVSIAARRRVHVLVDEVYLEACFDPSARSAFHLGGNVLTTGSLTKAYGLSGLRCGWILAPPPLAHRMWRLNDLFGVVPPHPAERLSVVALDHLPAIAVRAQALLTRNRRLLDAFLDGRADLDVVRPGAGTIVFPRWAGGRVDELCRLLRERYETSVVPGRFFGAPEHFRLGFGGETAMVEEGLARLGRALDELRLAS